VPVFIQFGIKIKPCSLANWQIFVVCSAQLWRENETLICRPKKDEGTGEKWPKDPTKNSEKKKTKEPVRKWAR